MRNGSIERRIYTLTDKHQLNKRLDCLLLLSGAGKTDRQCFFQTDCSWKCHLLRHSTLSNSFFLPMLIFLMLILSHLNLKGFCIVRRVYYFSKINKKENRKITQHQQNVYRIRYRLFT